MGEARPRPGLEPPIGVVGVPTALGGGSLVVRGGGGSIGVEELGVETDGREVPKSSCFRFIGLSWMPLVSLLLTVTESPGRSIFMVEIGEGVKPYAAVASIVDFNPAGICRTTVWALEAI